MNYIPKNVRLSFLVDTEQYESGDYALLYSNGGTGAVDYSRPANNQHIELFPYGMVMGWGELPWGESPWGLGGTRIIVNHQVAVPGTWMFALKAYDAAGNEQQGVEETEISVSLTPATPSALKLVSYDKAVDVIVFKV